MKGAAAYETAQRRNGIEAVHLAMRSLREHGWSHVCIQVRRVDAEGCVQSYDLDLDPDDDDGDDDEGDDTLNGDQGVEV